MKKYKIQPTSIGTSPVRAVYSTVVILLALEVWNAPEWLWGALIAFVVFAWIVVIVAFFQERTIDPFEDLNNPNEKPTREKGRFERLLKEKLK